MRRLLLFAPVLVAGCASPARYIEQSTNGGVVACPDKESRNQAMFLIYRHVGLDYKILSEGNEVCGSKFDETGAATTGTEYRIHYTRASNPTPSTPQFSTFPVQWPAPPITPQEEGVTP
jgi:hypothetical protein